VAFLLPLGRATGQAVDNSTEQQVMDNLPSSYANHSSNESSTELQDKCYRPFLCAHLPSSALAGLEDLHIVECPIGMHVSSTTLDCHDMMVNLLLEH